MARVYQVPQHAFIWLFLGALLSCAPHFLNTPAWLSIFVSCLLLWRWLVQRGSLRQPRRFVRTLLLVAAVLATLYSYGTVLGPEAGIALLVCAYALKLLELHSLRDAYVSLVLCYFVLATVLLADRSFFTSLYVMATLVVITAALIGINQPEAQIRPGAHFRYGAALVFQAIPMMLFLFVTVPRVAPFWELPQQSRQARTGMSDSMSLGEVSELSRSAELAFRVEFEGELPPPSQRYWRGLTYSWFDGRRWAQAVPRQLSQIDYVVFPGDPRPEWFLQLRDARQAPAYRYNIIMEASGREWLYALATPFTQNPEIGIARDNRLVGKEPVFRTFSYSVSSYPGLIREPLLSDREREFNLRLPGGTNPRARALAQQWRDQAGDAEAFIERLLSWFRTEPFFYTLQPPPLGPQQIDDFLFSTRAGFCEHYASSAAFMLRSAGIPARVVAGYQGGELNPLGTHLLVRQYDAHAWVEAWLPGRGWVELDPTAMVAPERIELGLEEALAEQGAEFSSAFQEAVGLSRLPVMQQLANLSDYVQYNWTRLVLGYDSSSQQGLLRSLIGEYSPWRAAALMASGVVTLTLLVGLYLWWSMRGPALSWWQREYWRLWRGLKRQGAEFGVDTPPASLYLLASKRWPKAEPALKRWAGLYLRVAYAEVEKDTSRAQDKRALRQATQVVLRQIR